ncbi:tyrosine-type recombinase/integrase [Comamonas sp.]|uniref:tyrosine-type recombinase/integrase n=1 Tax=Comamonas sp. TaxID=34028 RepID=UPI00258B55A9|nr:tyrosine-type recombinase/integrase [Comamonas sp.]
MYFDKCAGSRCDEEHGWDERFGDFLTDLQLQEGLAESTLLVLKNQLTAFNRWVYQATGHTWDRAVPEDFYEYLLNTEGLLETSSLQARRWSLKRLYSWANDEGVTSIRNHTFDFSIRAVKQVMSEMPPSVEQIHRLLEQPDTSRKEGVRDRAILELLYATGMRAAELLSLSVFNLQSESLLKVWGKGRKERLVVYGEEAKYWIAKYKVVRNDLLHKGGHAALRTNNLFVSTGKHPGYQYFELRRMLKKYGQACGLHVTPHRMRHAFATHMYQAGAPLKFVQMLLGHENLQTSTIYIAQNSKDHINFLKHHHPRNSKSKIGRSRFG